MLIMVSFLGVVEEYQPPFFDSLHQDPSFDDVHYVVSIQKIRPEIPNRWLKDPVRIFYVFVTGCTD